MVVLWWWICYLDALDGVFYISAVDGGSFTSIKWWIFYIDSLDAGVFYIVAVDGGGSVTSMP